MVKTLTGNHHMRSAVAGFGVASGYIYIYIYIYTPNVPPTVGDLSVVLCVGTIYV
jgi:hypothetical protein